MDVLMSTTRIARTLWFDTRDGGRETISQADLPGRHESIVVLGEAGMGKTELLRWIGQQPGHVYCTARRLKNAGSNPSRILGTATTLVIDALDELSAKDDGDAVDTVLQRLADLGFPRFVLSCRIADWRHVTGKDAIKEQYPDLEPFVAHLQPLDEVEIRRMLVAELDGNESQADEVMGRLAGSNLAGLMGNPQTLQMIARVARGGPLPETKAGLFAGAVDVLRREHSHGKFELQPDAEAAFEAAGAAFAALILTGAEAIVVESADPGDIEIPLAEAAALPGASQLRSVLGSRLFGTAAGPNRLTYWHRSIGEYLGARYLARQAHTVMRRKRLLALFHAHGVVPASLRGLHAWLALHSGDLAAEVIAADPSGVIEYGDVAALNSWQAELLLDALERTAAQDQRFAIGDGAASAMRGLMRADMLARVRAVITTESLPYGLRMLLIESVAGSEIAEPLRPVIRDLVCRSDNGYAVRWAAFEALKSMGGEDWPAVLQVARHSGNNGPRMAVDIVKHVGPAVFMDRDIVGVAIQYAQQERRMIMQFTALERAISDDRLEGVLDAFAEQLTGLGSRHERRGNDELTDMGYRLIQRRLSMGAIEPARLWGWLRHFDAEIGYRREERVLLHTRLRDDDELRRGIQRLVLLDEPGTKTVWQRSHRLNSRSGGLAATEQDVVHLLETMDPQSERSDDRWQDVVRMAPHSATDGVQVRAAALRFAQGRPDIVEWLDQLTVSPAQQWEIDNARRARRHARETAARWGAVRRDMSGSIDEIRAGRVHFIISLAEAYLDLFHDLDHDQAPVDRLTTWVGPEVTAAALAGFEAFLHADIEPSAQQMAESNAESRRWNASKVIAAALSERVRLGRGFDGVSDDRLTAGFLELRGTRIDDHAKLTELQPAVDNEVQARGLLETALRLWIEPQLQRRLSHVDQLVSLMWTDADSQRAATLAQEWLTTYPEMAADPEATLVDRLIESRRYDVLAALASARLAGALSDERRRNWEAASVVADFEKQRDRLSTVAASDSQLLWSIRRRAFHGRSRQSSVVFSVDQLVWIFESFRGASQPAAGLRTDGPATRTPGMRRTSWYR
nr:hypothetical protein [Paucibacter sp. M5-1]MCZ7881552.1 hypothetical protein [Paucibacter sp. M5-1]